MRVLVCGDRRWTNKALIDRALHTVDDGALVIIHGAAPGADALASRVATDHGWLQLPYPALWDLYGRRAGPLRNQRMLDEGKPDLVLAFHDRFWQSKGTFDMVTRASAARVPVQRYTSADWDAVLEASLTPPRRTGRTGEE